MGLRSHARRHGRERESAWERTGEMTGRSATTGGGAQKQLDLPPRRPRPSAPAIGGLAAPDAPDPSAPTRLSSTGYRIGTWSPAGRRLATRP